MRHKYAARAIVLGRTPIKEAGLSVTLLTSDLGLVRARAEGLRKPGSKLAHALQTLAESEVTLVRGKEGWRLAGAVLAENWFDRLDRAARQRAGRRGSLILRLVQGEAADERIFDTFREFLQQLPARSEAEQDQAELRTTLVLLHLLGLDEGPVPSLEEIAQLSESGRLALIARIQRDLEASGL